MQNKLFAILITALLVLLMAGSAMCAMYDESVDLVRHNDLTEIRGVLSYNITGEKFAWHVNGTVPERQPKNKNKYNDSDFDLLYRPAGPDPIPLLIAVINVTDWKFNESGVTELDGNLPRSPDTNILSVPCGADIWLRPIQVSHWKWRCMRTSELIWYDDTDANETPEIERYYDGRCVQAGEEVEILVTVEDRDGRDDLENMVVTANMSMYGIEEIVTLTYVEDDYDCIHASYSATVIPTKSTVQECDRNGMFEFPITAEDPTGLNDTVYGYLDVEPGPCAYMELQNLYGEDDELRTVALTQLSYCNVKDYSKWWSHHDRHIAYMIIYTVEVYDEYDNYIGNIRDKCCDGFTATLTGEDASIKYCGYGRITMVNENNPGMTTLSVHCVDSSIPDITQEVEFLNPISSLEVTSDVDVLYAPDDVLNITAQILDVLGDPISMPGIEVRLYDNSIDQGWIKTDENGSVTYWHIVEDLETGDNITFRAEAECREGTLELDVVDKVLDYIEINAPIQMEFGEEQCITCTCYTNHSTEMCCDDGVWSCNEFGDVNETTGWFTASDTEGVAVVEVNVSGVIGTVDIVINGIDCEGYAAMASPGVPGNLSSGTVMVSWNFTGNGTVCVQALGDPIPEWGNDTKGASVSVETHDECGDETATLDLNGTGDTWMQNKTTGNWSFYAAGDTSEVGLGIQQMFALVYDEPAPDPDPDPTPTATTSRSSRGGGGGGTYPPDPVPTLTPNATTTSEDPKPADAKPTVNLPGGDTTLDTTPDEEDDAPAGTDPTNAILLVLALLAVCVIGYVIYRRSQN